MCRIEKKVSWFVERLKPVTMIFREFHEMDGTKQTLSYSFRFELSLTRQKQWHNRNVCVWWPRELSRCIRKMDSISVRESRSSGRIFMRIVKHEKHSSYIHIYQTEWNFSLRSRVMLINCWVKEIEGNFWTWELINKQAEHEKVLNSAAHNSGFLTELTHNGGEYNSVFDYQWFLTSLRNKQTVRLRGPWKWDSFLKAIVRN